jgi:hypothetical protein
MYDISGELTVILITMWWLQAAQDFDVKRFNLKKQSDLQVRNCIRLRFQTGLQLWAT